MSFKYYDVESGTEREVDHGRDCPCGTCSKARLKDALCDIIGASRAFAPTARRKGYEEFYGRAKKRPTVYHDPIEEEPIEDYQCFGWLPNGPDERDFMFLKDQPMSPDMTKNDMAVMSVDQARAVLTLKVLYNPFFNQRLKERIEPKYRNWNPTNKCWELHPSKMKDVQQICAEFYKGTQIIGQKPVLGTKFEKLLTRLTKDDKQSIYRLMALKYHPDKGGDHETMSLLNEVFKQ